MIYADSGIIMRWVEGGATVREPIELRWRNCRRPIACLSRLGLPGWNVAVSRCGIIDRIC